MIDTLPSQSFRPETQRIAERQQNYVIEEKFHGHHIKFQIGTDINLDQVLEDYKSTYEAQELVFSYLASQEAFYIRAQELRHPLIFYYGHTMAMYINKFMENGLIGERVNGKFETMFAIGVDQMDWDDLDEKHYDWPTLQQVKSYRKKVNEIIIKITQHLINKKVTIYEPIWDILMCLEHQKVHIETSSCIIRRVPISMIKTVPELKECPFRQHSANNIPKNELIEVNDYHFEWKFNKDNTNMYLFDNEMGSAESNTKGFKISKFQVSNGEFLQFIESGGYQNLVFWTVQGKAWLKSKERRHPIYWFVDKQIQQTQQEWRQKFKLRTMSEIIEMPWNWPVEVNQLEAQAFCNWKSFIENKTFQLPTQQEFFAVRDENIPKICEREFLQGNFDRNYWYSPCPVDLFKEGKVFNIVGNVWEHTRTPFHPFSGFKVQSDFEDYSAPYFDEKHGTLFGGSFASGKKDALVTRNWFRHHFYNFIGFRYTISENQVQNYVSEEEEKFFEYDQEITESIKMHYFNPNSYIEKVLTLIKDNENFIEVGKKDKALIIGGNVGRLTLQLGEKFDKVTCIDYSARYFKIAAGFLSTGVIYENHQNHYTLQDLNLQKKENVTFMICSPQNPDFVKLRGFNLIVVDGKGLRSQRLSYVLKGLKRFKTKDLQTRVIVISSQQNQNAVSTAQLRQLSDKHTGYYTLEEEKGIQVHIFDL